MNLHSLGLTQPKNAHLAAELLGTPSTTRDNNSFPLLFELANNEQHRFGLLLWPGAGHKRPIPLVKQGPNGIELIAPSVDLFLHKQFVLADVAGSLDHKLARSTGLYEPGAALKHPLMYQMAKGLFFPPDYATIAQERLRQGRVQEAIITVDRGFRSCEGWARPFVQQARVYTAAKRLQEARDAAQAALDQPLWTLGEPIEWTAKTANWKLPIDTSRYIRLAENDQATPLARASHWLDACFLEKRPWSECRERLFNLYNEAGAQNWASWVSNRAH